MNEICDHFNIRAHTYENADSWVNNSLLIKQTIDFIDFENNDRFIDIGGGTGIISKHVLQLKSIKLNKNVVLDISQNMLDLIDDPNIEICRSDAINIPFKDAAFNKILCRQSLHYMEDICGIFNELKRIMDTNGKLIICQITPQDNKDLEYWQKIVSIRQPLRKHYFTSLKLHEHLLHAHFKPVMTRRLVITESLHSWLQRYFISPNDKEMLLNLFYNAPLYYKKIHDFRNINNDITFSQFWTFIKAVPM